MSIPLNLHKNKIQNKIREILEKDPTLNEIFDSSPFKTEFQFGENSDEIYSKFKDSKDNIIRVIFHKMRNDCYLLDFTVNGDSYKAANITYSLKEYTSLLATIAKALNQFLIEKEPNAIKIDGADSFEKIEKNKQGQKINIYDYFSKHVDKNPKYSIQYKSNGNFDLIKTIK